MFNQIAKPIADSCMQGYNGTIFAYGQTGAGKTFTIQGPSLSVDGCSGEHQAFQDVNSDQKTNRGIMQRSFEYIFQNIEAQKRLVDEKADGSELFFLIKCSYLEIYNEQIMDLLEPSSVNLHVREDIKKGVYVEGLQEELVNTYKDMIQIIQRGSKNRHVGSTALNRESSRSHSVLTTIIESKSMSHTGVWNVKTSRFHIIDLAGSERSKNTNAVGERLKEAGMINKSLSTLGNVINSLVDQSEGKSRHIPYRDSKLTFILRDSLGGNSKTVIIANISPSAVNVGETLSTLEFAKRAKQIKNRAVVNEDSSGTILVLKNEIRRLKKDLVESNKLQQSLLAQQHSQQQILLDTANQVCKICSTNFVMDRVEAAQLTDAWENLGHEDSLLIDDLETAQPPRQGSIIGGSEKVRQQNERIQHVERLLQANLENLTTQQSYFERETQNLKNQIQQQNDSYEALNQQANRDKMKLKLREDKILKLEQEKHISTDENCQMLQKELQLMRLTMEQEKQDNQNPKIAKLTAENNLLKSEKNLLETMLAENADKNPQTIVKLYKEQQSLIIDLTNYLKRKASAEAYESLEIQFQECKNQNKRLLENEQGQQDQMDELQQQYDVLMEQNVLAETLNQKLTREYGKAQVEISTLLEQLQALENEVRASATISSEQTLQINSLQARIKDQELKHQAQDQKIEQSKENQEDLEAKLNQLQDFLTLKEQVIAQKDDILEQKNENIRSLKLEINELQQLINQTVQESDARLSQLSELKQQIELQKAQSQENDDYKVQEQLKINENLLIQVEEVNKKKNQFKNQLAEAQDNLSELKQISEQKLQALQTELNKQTEIIREAELKYSQKEQEIDNQKKYQIEKMLEMNEAQHEEHLKLYDELEKQMANQQSNFDSLCAAKDKTIGQQASVINKHVEDIRDLQNNYNQLRADKSYLDESINEISCSFQQQSDHNEKQNQIIKNLHEEISQLRVELRSKEEALKQQEVEEKTAGAWEQERAENAVLVLEAKNLLEDKILEIQKLTIELSQYQKHNKELLESIAKLDAQILNKQLDLGNLQKLLATMQGEIQKLENEKDDLLFKKDEDFKNLGQKVEQLKNQNKNIEILQKETEELQKRCHTLEYQLESEYKKHNKDINLEKCENYLKEVSEMQIFIDELSERVQQLQIYAEEMEKLKQGCYAKVQLIQSQQKKGQDIQNIENLEDETQRIKHSITQVISQISDIQLYHPLVQEPNQQDEIGVDSSTCNTESKSVEINILISQIVCEVSKLYEQQLVLEKQKAAVDYKKQNEKYEKLKKEVKLYVQKLNEQAQKLNDQSSESKKEKSQLREQLELEYNQVIWEKDMQNDDLLKKIHSIEENCQDKVNAILQEQMRLIQDRDQNYYQKEKLDREIKDQMQMQINQKEEIMIELERYKVYLPEADGLLQEVNERHKIAIQEIKSLQKESEEQQKLNQQYENEILDLNKNLKSQKKMLQDQKQLYEVRVQSQEQEIEQHQFRYRELEQKQHKDLQMQEGKFDQLQKQMESLSKTTKQAKNDREMVIQQMQQLEQQVQLAQERDMHQKNDIQTLKMKLQRREIEVAEGVKTLRQYAEANKYLENELQNLKEEFEMMAGHKNPNQKIQLHQKIKQENNRLREDNIRLQEDLSKKIETIQKLQKDSRNTMEGTQKTHLQDLKNENKIKKDFETLMMHLISSPQLEKIAIAHGLNLEVGGSQSLQKTLGLITMVDEILEHNQESLRNLSSQKNYYEGQLQKLTSQWQKGPQENFGANSSSSSIKQQPVQGSMPPKVPVQQPLTAMHSSQKYKSPFQSDQMIVDSRSTSISQGQNGAQPQKTLIGSYYKQKGILQQRDEQDQRARENSHQKMGSQSSGRKEEEIIQVNVQDEQLKQAYLKKQFSQKSIRHQDSSNPKVDRGSNNSGRGSSRQMVQQHLNHYINCDQEVCQQQHANDQQQTQQLSKIVKTPNNDKQNQTLTESMNENLQSSSAPLSLAVRDIPVTLNSYSSLYRQQNSYKQSSQSNKYVCPNN